MTAPRGATGRDAWRWPLWSWRNLTISGLVVVALLWTVARLPIGGEPGGSSDQRVSSALATGAPTTSPPTPTATAPGPGTGPASGAATTPSTGAVATVPIPSAPTPPATTAGEPTAGPRVNPRSVVSVAGGFVRAWARPDLDRSAWLKGVEVWSTRAYRTSLATVDPARVPATRLTGDPQVVERTVGDAVVEAPTDGGRVRLTLVSGPTGWRVSGIGPADQPPAAETPDLGGTSPSGGA